MPTQVSAFINPPGGTVTFQISGFASGAGSQMTIGRAVSGDAYTQIFSGLPQVVYIDPGEGLPVGLSTGSNYFWQFQDSAGLVTVGPIQPAPYLVFQDYWLTAALVRVIRNGVDNLILPNSTQRAEVFHDMPLAGFQALPAITISQVLFQQEAIGIGQQAPHPLAKQNGMWSIPAVVQNTWMITVFAKDVQTREYYRDAVIGIYESSLDSVFARAGQNISHSFQCHNYQWTDDLHGVSPGFYCCDIMFKQSGMFTIGVQYALAPIIGVLSVPSASGVMQSGLARGI